MWIERQRTYKMEMGWDDQTNEKIVTGHIKPVNCLCVLGDGTTLCSGSDDLTIQVWDTLIPEGKDQPSPIRCVMKGHRQPILALCTLTDGVTIASGSKDRTIMLWETYKGQALTTLVGCLGWVRNLIMLKVCFVCWRSFFAPPSTLHSHLGRMNDVLLIRRAYPGHGPSQDETSLCSACDDKSVRLWNTAVAQASRCPDPSPTNQQLPPFDQNDRRGHTKTRVHT